MIVPEHWAEARRQYRTGRRQVTVRRFGWSDASVADAEAMAEQRVADAVRRIVAGETLDRREAKVPYNGASGVPIREEVLARHGDEVITRNAYGARCLNTPRALFADVDFDALSGAKGGLVAAFGVVAAAVAAGVSTGRWGLAVVVGGVGVLVLPALVAWAWRAMLAARGGAERVARRRVDGFIAAHPGWSLRVYRTPNGLRLLATHQPFDARSPEVADFFAAVGADPVYVRMCVNQHCFRARLTAKPWRIGIDTHLKPRRGVWPVPPERLAERAAWVAAYEARAATHAACRFVEVVGSGAVHLALTEVIALHDRESRADRALAIA